MSDVFVALPSVTGEEATWFGYNSHREPGEAQIMERWPGAVFSRSAPLQVTHATIPQAERTRAVILSCPHWMWGAQVGVNAQGVAIGLSVVPTRLRPSRDEQLTGGDLVRLTLERSDGAEGALECLIELLARYGQGGRSGWRDESERHHHSFLIADAHSAWVLETAGPHWAAARVRSMHVLSSVLTLEQDFDRISDGAFEEARRRGWCTSHQDFGFARAFSPRGVGLLSGARARRACLLRQLAAHHQSLDARACIQALSAHNGHEPRAGLRQDGPCAHASWHPTRCRVQTNGSLLAQLAPEAGPRIWATGTSAPCLSVYKPMGFEGPASRPGPRPTAHYDGVSLFWLHERLHRVVLKTYHHRRASFEGARRALQRRALQSVDPDERQLIWDEHLEALRAWISVAEGAPQPVTRPLDELFWVRQSRRDRLPLQGS